MGRRHAHRIARDADIAVSSVIAAHTDIAVTAGVVVSSAFRIAVSSGIAIRSALLRVADGGDPGTPEPLEVIGPPHHPDRDVVEVLELLVLCLDGEQRLEVIQAAELSRLPGQIAAVEPGPLDLQAGLAALGYASGPTVGAFALGLFTKSANTTGTMVGRAAGSPRPISSPLIAFLISSPVSVSYSSKAVASLCSSSRWSDRSCLARS